MATATEGNSAHNLWRRAIHAFTHACDPAREGPDADTVFQPSGARARAERNAHSFANAAARQNIPPSMENLS